MTETPKAYPEACFLWIRDAGGARHESSEAEIALHLKQKANVSLVHVECNTVKEVAEAVKMHTPKYVLVNVNPKAGVEICNFDIGQALFECSTPDHVAVVFVYGAMDPVADGKLVKWVQREQVPNIVWWKFKPDHIDLVTVIPPDIDKSAREGEPHCVDASSECRVIDAEIRSCCMNIFIGILFAQLSFGAPLPHATGRANADFIPMTRRKYYSDVMLVFPSISGSVTCCCPTCNEKVPTGFLGHTCTCARTVFGGLE
jgi:hypothetical protein